MRQASNEHLRPAVARHNHNRYRPRMPASLDSIARLPGLPLMLSDEQAAAYFELSRETFRKAVEYGHYPQPVRQFGRRVLWHRPALERAAAEIAGERVSGGHKPLPVPQSEIEAWLSEEPPLNERRPGRYLRRRSTHGNHEHPVLSSCVAVAAIQVPGSAQVRDTVCTSQRTGPYQKER